jgi:hypothetical protein
VRAGLPPTSRTRTGDCRPSCKPLSSWPTRCAEAQPFHTVDVSRRPDLARRYAVAVVPAAFRVAGDGTVLERLA